MGKFVLGLLLSVVSFAFATSNTPVNPLCSMVQALSNNWGTIMVLIAGILGVMVIVSGAVNLIQGKFAFALAVVIGGAVLLVASYRLLGAAGDELRQFANTCQGAQIEFVHPVAKVE
jgi:type IV secretory pathway VirB2 component (pilin)